MRLSYLFSRSSMGSIVARRFMRVLTRRRGWIGQHIGLATAASGRQQQGGLNTVSDQDLSQLKKLLR
jgi:hypothetical protein